LLCILTLYAYVYVKVLYKDPVVSIDSNTQTVATSSGKTIKYGSLIISTGSVSVRYCFMAKIFFFSTIFSFFYNNLFVNWVMK
jgi:hypothetical protein